MQMGAKDFTVKETDLADPSSHNEKEAHKPGNPRYQPRPPSYEPRSACFVTHSPCPYTKTEARAHREENPCLHPSHRPEAGYRDRLGTLSDTSSKEDILTYSLGSEAKGKSPEAQPQWPSQSRGLGPQLQSQEATRSAGAMAFQTAPLRS